MLISFYRTVEEYEKQLAEIKQMISDALWQRQMGMTNFSDRTLQTALAEIALHEKRIRTIRLAVKLGFHD